MTGVLKGRLTLVRLAMLTAAVALLLIGILVIYASENPAETRPDQSATTVKWRHCEKQIVFCPLALFAFIAANAVHYRKLGPASYWIYAAVLLLLAVLLVDKTIDLRVAGWDFVPVVNYARRWFRLPGVQIQPSELCKLAYVLALAWYLRYRKNYLKFTGLIGPFALTLVPMALILAEPNLSTVVLMMPILFVMLFVAGARTRHLVIIAILAVLVSPLLWHYGMKPYQRMRISSVLLQNEWLRQKAQENETLGAILAGGSSRLKNWDREAGYHLKHSKFAIASGGLAGYGFRHGPYIKYGQFLPERHNDFIFVLIGHQWGFVGCLLVLALYAVIIACGLEIAVHNTEPFGRLIAVGIVAMFAVEVLVNISMTLGLMPITGLTLPLVSYGGSSLMVSAAALGLLNNVGKSRPFSVAGEPFSYK